MLCVPAVSVDVTHLALAAASATEPQPEMALPLSVKATVPVGELPVTVAVKVTPAPEADGLSELASAVDVAPPLGVVTCSVIEPAAPPVAETTLIVTP